MTSTFRYDRRDLPAILGIVALLLVGLPLVVAHDQDIARWAGVSRKLVRTTLLYLGLYLVLLTLVPAARRLATPRLGEPEPEPRPRPPVPRSTQPIDRLWPPEPGPEATARRLRHGREVVEGRHREADVALIVGADARLELQVRPDAPFQRLDHSPDRAARDRRIVELARRGCTRVRNLGKLVVARMDRPASRMSRDDVVALLDLVLDLIAHPPGDVPVVLGPAREGVVCPWCRDELQEQDPDVAACPRCGTSHHADCFEENGGCTVFGCADRPKARERA